MKVYLLALFTFVYLPLPILSLFTQKLGRYLCEFVNKDDKEKYTFVARSLTARHAMQSNIDKYQYPDSCPLVESDTCGYVIT